MTMVVCCERCGKTFKYRYLLINHLERKIVCPGKNSDTPSVTLLETLLSEKPKEYACRNCGRRYSSSQSRCNHQRQCTVQKRGTEIVKVQQPPTQLNSFGRESLCHLLDNKIFLTSCLMDKDVVRLIECIYFDQDHPQNQNVRLKSKKQEFMEVWMDGKWTIVDQNETIDEMIDRGLMILRLHSRRNAEQLLDEWGDTDDHDTLNAAIEWLEKVRIANKDNTKTRKPIGRHILLLLLNHGDS